MKISKIIPYVLCLILISLLSWVIYRQIHEYHLQDDPMLKTLKQILEPIFEEYPQLRKIKLYKGEKSYTINKEKTFMCLYDEKGEYYDLNTILHVLLHEYAHSLNTKDIGHTEEFYRIFDELLQKATDLKVYNPEIPVDKNYCLYPDKK
jgi:hypothetical protein